MAIANTIFIKDCQWVSSGSAPELIQPGRHVVVALGQGGPVLGVDGVLCGNEPGALPVLYMLPSIPAEQLGDPAFRQAYGLRYAYYAGSMANGISSPRMIAALAQAGVMGSYGTGGVSLPKLEAAINEIKSLIPEGRPFMVNILHNMQDPEEKSFKLVRMCIEKGVPAIEASAFINLTRPLLYYKLSGLVRQQDGAVLSTRKIIAKLSREEVARRFLSPPEPAMVESLRRDGYITDEQAQMAAEVAVADDITVEADSGGHTDNQPLVSLFPAMVALRDEMQGLYQFRRKVRMGAGGGIGSPASALAAYQMGAAYVVTGSINQGTVESGTSDYVKEALAQVTMGDVVMAPCADLFELGTKVQVIKRGTMYPMNAQKLYDLYSKYNAIEELPEKEVARLEKSYFKMPVAQVWEDCEDYFRKNNPDIIGQARKNPRIKLAMLFRWYLGKSSWWAVEGAADRRMDMQIWCGQAMGAFNAWAKGTDLEPVQNRHVGLVAQRIMEGAATLLMQRTLQSAGILGV